LICIFFLRTFLVVNKYQMWSFRQLWWISYFTYLLYLVFLIKTFHKVHSKNNTKQKQTNKKLTQKQQWLYRKKKIISSKNQCTCRRDPCLKLDLSSFSLQNKSKLIHLYRQQTLWAYLFHQIYVRYCTYDMYITESKWQQVLATLD
jgi:Ca2+/Na+ antiporter